MLLYIRQSSNILSDLLSFVLIDVIIFFSFIFYLRSGGCHAGGHDVRVGGSVPTAGHELHTGGVGAQVPTVVIGCGRVRCAAT